jgi:hypothetical protein
VVCRVFRKKNYQKTLESPKSSSCSLDSKAHQILGSGNDGVLDQILLYMGRTCKMENETFSNMNISNNNSSLRFLSDNSISDGLHERFMHLPRLDSPPLPSIPLSSPSFDQDRSFKSCYHQSYDEMLTENEPSSSNQIGNGTFDMISSSVIHGSKSGQLNDWVTLDRLVASQLNGHEAETSKHLSCFTTGPNASFGLSPDHHQTFKQILLMCIPTRMTYGASLNLRLHHHHRTHYATYRYNKSAQYCIPYRVI